MPDEMTPTDDAPMRSRFEIEARLRGLVRLLTGAECSDDYTVRAHARALDLVWVLNRALSFDEQRATLDEMIAEGKARREGGNQ
jgi:hypothetical protein